MNRVLLAIGGLLVGLLALLFAAPAMVDWNRYRGIFEEEATRLLGREVRVGGRVNLRLLPVPYVRFEQVRVADTTASVGRPLFMAEDFTVWLSIGALLAGGFEASDIELRRPVVTLVLDGKGGGSWTSLAADKVQTGFVPAKVAFDAVRITDGTLAILAPDGAAKSSFEHINGELSAQALEGPYKVSAAFSARGAPREIRLSTAKPAEDGSVRFKGTVRDPGSGVSYSLDGAATDVLRTIKVTGELTARLPLPAAMASGGGGGDAGGLFSGRARQAGGEFDVRAQLKGDTTGFTLADLALSFEQAGRPQLATGSARVSWVDRTDVAVTLKSHWLDLDRIAGAGTGASALELAQGVASAVSRVLDTEGRTGASLTIDQATLGGDVASGLVAELEQKDGRLDIKSLTAALPGGARISAAGTFEGKGTELRYNGRINLRGASLARFAGWAWRGQGLPLPSRDGAFTIVGELSLGPKEIAGRSLSLEVGRNMLTGDASWKAGQPQRIVLALEGSELDLTPLVPQGAEPVQALRDLVAGLAGGKAAAGAATVVAADAEIKLRVDRLVVGAATFRDAVGELKLSGGNLSMPQLRLASPDGYMVELRGDITDLAKPAAKGSLTGLVVADTPAGAVALARAAGLPADLVPRPEDAAVLLPARLAGKLQVGLKGPDTHDIAFDGTLAESRVAGTVRLGAQKASWRDRPSDIAVTAEGRGIAQLLARKAAATGQTPSARLMLRGIGNPQGGMATLAAVDADGTSAEYRGRAVLDDSGALGLDGEIALALADLGRGLSLAGVPTRAGLDGPVAGTMRIERGQGRTKLTSAGLKLAGIETSGTLTAEAQADGHRITGAVKMDRGSLPGLLAVLTSPQPQPSPRRGAERGSPWSEAPIDIAVLDGLAGSRIKFEVGQLALAPGLELAEAVIDASARSGGLDLKLTDGKSAGGQAVATLSLDKAAAGARLAVQGSLTGVRLERLGQRAGGQTTASGGLSVNVRMESTALSPRGLVVALAGSGEVALAQARLNRWNPSAVATAAEAVLGIKGEIPAGALRTQLELALEGAGLGLGSPRLAVTVADGALRTAPLVATSSNGRLTGRASVDLDRVSIEGDWRLEPRHAPPIAGQPQKPELPGVTIAYAGPLGSLATLEPRLDLEALEREVAVRKVEREVAELERLRKLDEDRARDEALRIEAERKEVERRRAEQQLIEALGRPSDPAVVPQVAPAPQPQAAGPAALRPGQPAAGAAQQGTALPTASDAAAPAPGQPGQPAAQTPLAEPPTTVDRRPLPRPGPARAPTAQRRDPFAGN